MPTHLERFPLCVRAGSIMPLAEGAQCAADLPKPARTLWVFSGMDGRFDWYDDDGDGDAGKLRIPLRYEDADATLTLGRCTSVLAKPVMLTIRLIQPDGESLERVLRYDGMQVRISFRD